MFYPWLMYRLATLFSMAVLSFMISMVLDLTIRVAGALWMGNAINDLRSMLPKRRKRLQQINRPACENSIAL